jgi:hypothetical protein
VRNIHSLSLVVVDLCSLLMVNLPIELQGKVAIMGITSLFQLPFYGHTTNDRTCVAFLLDDDAFQNDDDIFQRYFQFSRAQTNTNEYLWHIAPCFKEFVLILFYYQLLYWFDLLFSFSFCIDRLSHHYFLLAYDIQNNIIIYMNSLNMMDGENLVSSQDVLLYIKYTHTVLIYSLYCAV